jgi:ABC-2 type transport system ATP-binding protein
MPNMDDLTSLRWFRRRRVGLGWRPASWQGWAVTFLAVTAAVTVVVVLRASSARIPSLIVILALYALVALLTGGRRADEPRLAGDAPESPAAPSASSGLSDEQRESLRMLTDMNREKPHPETAALVVEHLTKRFGNRVAVDDVSFSVAAGEVFGFLGPNGAGKTTTVRMLATLISPTSGSARIAGVPLEPARGLEIRQRIAVMPENPGLYLRLTVAENLEYFAGLYGLRDPRRRIAHALQAVNLGERADDLCGGLSKGLRQRVGLARVLLSDPAVIFLDEPTSGLDPVASREVHDLIDGLRSRGVTVFLTTHRLEEAERLCDQVAILNTRLRTVGRPDELRDRLFTKTLLVRTAAELADPARVFTLPGVERWQPDGPAGYLLTVSDARTAAPEVARALVAAGADLLSLSQERHSLEDVYLELIDDDVETTT